MEYCDEGTLEEVSRLGLQEHVIRLYSKQIAIAINVLHEHGIVHRDIKGNPALASRRAPSSASHAPLRRAPRWSRRVQHTPRRGACSVFLPRAKVIPRDSLRAQATAAGLVRLHSREQSALFPGQEPRVCVNVVNL